MWDRNKMLWYVQNCFWLLHFLKSHAMILCWVCKQLVVGSIVCRFHNHGQQVLTVSVVETPLTGAHLQSTASVLLKMGILYSKDCQRSRSESRPSQRHLAHSGVRRKWSYPSFSHAVPANKGGNVAKWRSRKAADIHESFCRANLQNTAGGKWRDPRHLPTSSVQSDMGSLKIHKLKPQPCLLPYLYEPFNSSSTNAATSSTSEPSKPSWKSILNHCGGTSGVRHW